MNSTITSVGGRAPPGENADAGLRISFARRSSGFSRSNSAIRAASSVVVPGRTPSSISAWVTQFRSVSGLMPNCLPTRANAPGLVAGSRRASTAIRVARSHSSSGYFLGAAMTLILTWIESLHQTRRGTVRGSWREGSRGTLTNPFLALRLRPAGRPHTDRLAPDGSLPPAWLLADWPEEANEP